MAIGDRSSSSTVLFTLGPGDLGLHREYRRASTSVVDLGCSIVVWT